MSAGGANTAGVSSSLDLNYINVMIFMNIYIYCLQVKMEEKMGAVMKKTCSWYPRQRSA